MPAAPRRLIMPICLVAVLLGGSLPAVVSAQSEVVQREVCVAEVEPNGDSAQAITFEGERCISGTLVDVGDVDVFLWQVDEVDAASTWSLDLTGVPQVDTTLVVTRVDSEDIAEVARIDVGPELGQTAAEVSVDAGTYALVVDRSDAASGLQSTDEGAYELRVAKMAATESASPLAADEGTARIVVVAADEVTPTIAGDIAIDLLLDTSGSMLKPLGKTTKLKAAERALLDLVDELPSGTPVALRTFKPKPGTCATVLRVPLQPLDRKAMRQTIRGLPARKGSRTPIAKAIEQVPQDLSGSEGHRLVVLVTDGEEDCGGDPAAAIAALSDAGYTSTVHLIGYALPDDDELQETLAGWAALGGGRFFEAPDRASLAAALEGAFTAPYLVFDAEGQLVAQGLLGDDGVEVDAGVYRVEVLSDPATSYEAVDLKAGAVVQLPDEVATSPTE